MVKLVTGDDVWSNITCSTSLYSNNQLTSELPFPGHCSLENVRVVTKTDLFYNDTTYAYRENFVSLTISGIVNFIPPNLFSVFTSLSILSINNGELLQLDPEDFRNGRQLTMLSLSNNSLTELVDYNFNGADRIEDLNLSENKIKTIGSLAFYNFINLINLQLSGNELELLNAENFQYILTLKSLSLDSNKLKNMEFISELKHLEILNLSNNRISYVNPRFFKNKPNLIELYMGNNCLFHFDFDKFYKISAINGLIKLGLSNNYLSEIEIVGLKRNFRMLDRFGIEGNNLNCSYLQFIVDAVGETHIDVETKTDINPNISGMICGLIGKDFHKLDIKC